MNNDIKYTIRFILDNNNNKKNNIDHNHYFFHQNEQPVCT